MSKFSVLFVSLSLLIFQVSAYFPSYYPEYCLKDLTKRDIPSLTSDQLSKVGNLLQVQGLLRHGARTPYDKVACWDDYDVEWNDCGVSELSIPTNNVNAASNIKWVANKLYDGSPNKLGGNCMTGQLISEGYSQEDSVGSSLNKAYLDDSLPSNLKLFETSDWTLIDPDNTVYFRADDVQRVLMSGQTAMNKMFQIPDDTIVPWHSGDYDLDSTYPNSRVCPRLDYIADKAYSSNEWQAIINSEDYLTLTNEVNNVFGADSGWNWDNCLDCIMTTVCTDREIPSGSVEQGTIMTEELFNQTVAFSMTPMAFLNVWNNSEWAKLAMSNITYSVRTNIENLINNDDNQKKFALFACHDTTILPFLAAVLGDNWDRVWPAYASLVTIEVYSSATSATEYLFRMVYNSKPLIVPGCDDSLCPLQTLLDAMAFADPKNDCVNPEPQDNCVYPDSNDDDDDNTMSKFDWAMLIILSSLLSAAISVFTTLYIIKKRNSTPLSTLEVNGSL